MDRAGNAVAQWQKERPDLDVRPMAVFGRLSYAALVVARDKLNPLFAQFGLRPLLTEMAKLWTGGERRKFAGNILKMAAGIALLTGLGVLGARLAGIPVLELLYGADLKGDRGILLLVMGYGGLNAVNTFLYDMIAVTRKQKWMLIGYGAAALAIFLLAPRMVQADGMRGAIHASIIAMALLDAVLAVILAAVITREGKE